MEQARTDATPKWDRRRLPDRRRGDRRKGGRRRTDRFEAASAPAERRVSARPYDPSPAKLEEVQNLVRWGAIEI